MKSSRIVTTNNPALKFYTHEISYSAKFELSSSDRMYHLRTSTNTDTKKSVVSMWVKRAYAGGGVYEMPLSWYNAAGYYGYLGFNPSDKLRMVHVQNSVVIWDAVSTPIFRDNSHWMHLWFKTDSTAAAADMLEIAVNGVPITDWDTYSNPASDYSNMSMASYNSWYTFVGGYTLGNYHFDGYIADLHVFDGSTPSYTEFGEFKYNTWIPKKFVNVDTYPYGNIGYRMDFADADDLDKDTSGNETSFTTNNSPEQSIDTPINNYPIFDKNTGYSTANKINLAGLRYSNDQNAWRSVNLSTPFPTTGTWQVEFEADTVTSNTYHMYGIVGEDAHEASLTYCGVPGIGYYATGGMYILGVAEYPAGTWDSLASGDFIQIVYNADRDEVSFYVNGIFQTTKDCSILPGTTRVASASLYYPNEATLLSHTSFTYEPTASAKSLCTENLPIPSILNPDKGFWIPTWTGDGTGDRDITGSSFSLTNSSLVWQKVRSQAYNHRLNDTERGANKVMYSNITDAEASDSVNGVLNEFLTNGFSTTAGTTGNDNWNMNTETYVAWVFNMITQYGMDIVTYTGDGVAGRTVSHNLGVVPEIIIVKRRNDASSWNVYHKYVDNTAPEDYYLQFDTDVRTDSNVTWNDTVPTTSTFTLGDSVGVNGNGDTYVAYLFRSVPGFMKVGYYEGNGYADGPRIFTDFRPRYLLIKGSTYASSWLILDTEIQPYNVIGSYLIANLTNVEGTSTLYDIYSNGFKVRTTSAAWNSSGLRWIYLAIADAPYPYCNTF